MLARQSLEIKRDLIENLTASGLASVLTVLSF